VRFFPGVSALSLVWGRSLFGGALLLVWSVCSIRPVGKIIDIKGNIIPILLLGLTAIGTLGFLTLGVQHGTITSTMFLLYTAPIFIIWLGKYLLNEHITQKDYLPIILAFLGLFFIFSGSLASKLVLGDVFGLLGGISWGLQIILGKKLGKKYSGLLLSLWMAIIGLILLGPTVQFQSLFSSNLVLLMIYGFVHSGIAPILFFEGIRYVSAKRAGLLSLIDPVENSILAFIIFSEIPTLGGFLGAILIVLSLITQALERKK